MQEGYSLSLSNVNTTNGTLDVILNNEGPVAGFQFNVDGVNVTGASGGSAEASGFTISTSATTVLGFSLTGATLSPANGVLVTVEFDSPSDEICLSGAILSNSDGASIDVEVGDCFDGFGCTDASACNYDPSASVDDGSCAYELDCNGECGGDGEIDDCGVCDGIMLIKIVKVFVLVMQNLIVLVNVMEML